MIRPAKLSHDWLHRHLDATIMPKKAAAGEKKSADKKPAGDKKGKGKSTGEDAEDKSSKGLKAATAVNAS